MRMEIKDEMIKKETSKTVEDMIKEIYDFIIPQKKEEDVKTEEEFAESEEIVEDEKVEEN